MSFNLLDENWIPVRRVSGRRDWIAPWQISEIGDPILEVASPRPDFDGALLQFLVGLVQTTSAPSDESAWRRDLQAPDPAALREAFEVVKPAFELLGDGPRFMQEVGLDAKDPTELGVERLLLDVPGEQTLEQNADVFVKRNDDFALGLPCAAMALLTLQINAPSGGRGFRTSLRGGGPLSTVLLGHDLWSTVWLNVLPRAEFESRGGDATLTVLERTFPWLGSPRLSESNEETGPVDIHPAQQFWATSRRVLLDQSKEPGVCMLSGVEGRVVRRAWVRSYGTNYKGAFDHPLTPYSDMGDGGPPNPRKLSTDGLPYRDWPAYQLGGVRLKPARVVQNALRGRRLDVYRRKTGRSARLLAFGYSMDNAKAEAWFAAAAPVFELPQEEGRFRTSAAEVAAMAEEVRKTLVSCVVEATKRRPDDLKDKFGNSLSASVTRRFWAQTEAGFLAAVTRLQQLCNTDASDVDFDQVKVEWIGNLREAACAIFEDVSQEHGEFAAADVRRVAMAWNRLVSWASVRSPKLRKVAGLPLLESEAGGSRRRTA